MKKIYQNDDELSLASHPMDKIPIRDLRFKFKKVENHNPVWSETNPEFSIFMNALGIHIPYFEKFLVKVMREYMPAIEDGNLIKDINNIIGQESQHAFNFLLWTKAMQESYPKLEKLDMDAKSYFNKALERKNKQFKIGFTAGYETFTFLGGMIILKRYKELMEVADPTVRAFWVWHQVEEVEHGSVAFDFFKFFYEKKEWYRRYMVVLTYCHIVKETFKAYSHMIKKEGYYSSLFKTFKAWKFFLSFGFELGYTALPVLKRDYHPRNHPICNDKQSEIAIAWREFYSSGNNTLTLTQDDMDVLLEKKIF